MLTGPDFTGIGDLLVRNGGGLPAIDGVFFANLFGGRPIRHQPLEAVPDPSCSLTRRFDFGCWSP